MLISTLMNTWGRPWKDFQGSLFVLFTFLSCEHLATWILSLFNMESPWALLHSLSLCHDLETLLKEWNRALVGMTSFVFRLLRISAFSVATQCFWKHLIHIFCLCFCRDGRRIYSVPFSPSCPQAREHMSA